MENCQISQIWLLFLKTSMLGNISDAAGLPQSRLRILEWTLNFGSRPKIWISGHFIFYLINKLINIASNFSSHGQTCLDCREHEKRSKTLGQIFSRFIFLGPRGPHGIPPLVSPLVSPQEKFGSHIYTHTCLLNHQKSHQTNPVQSCTAQYSLVPPITV